MLATSRCGSDSTRRRTISYAYDAGTLGAAGAGTGLNVGAENQNGSAGAQITGPPTSGYVIHSTDPVPGESLTYSFTVKGVSTGTGTVKTAMASEIVAGTTIVRSKIKVT